MVLPEGSERASSRPGTGGLMPIALAALAVVAGWALISQLAPAPGAPSAVEEPTTTSTTPRPTTTTIAPGLTTVETSEPLPLRPAGSLGEFFPLGVFEHGGLLTIFGAPQPPGPGTGESGLMTWTSTDASSWEPRGEAVEGAVVHLVVPADGGMLAAGVDAETGAPIVWTSGPGWKQSRLPSVEETSSIMTAAVAHEGGFVVAGVGLPASFARTLEALPEPYRSQEVGYGFRPGFGRDTVDVRGPLGLLLYRTGYEELGLDPVPREEEGVITWSGSPEAGWETTTIEASLTRSLAATDRGYYAAGVSRFGPGIWFSEDGRSWERTPSSGAVSLIGTLDGELVATRAGGVFPDFMTSPDGRRWERLGVSGLLDDRLTWVLGPARVGDGGIAGIATGYGPRRSSRELSLEADGYRLTGFQHGWLELSKDGDVITRVLAGSNSDLDAYTVDYEDGRLWFLAPESGDRLAGFDFEDLEAEEERSATPFPDQVLLLHSRDGAAWSVTDLGARLGLSTRVLEIGLTSETLVLLIERAISPLGEPLNVEAHVAPLDTPPGSDE